MWIRKWVRIYIECGFTMSCNISCNRTFSLLDFLDYVLWLFLLGVWVFCIKNRVLFSLNMDLVVMVYLVDCALIGIGSS